MAKRKIKFSSIAALLHYYPFLIPLIGIILGIISYAILGFNKWILISGLITCIVVLFTYWKFKFSTALSGLLGSLFFIISYTNNHFHNDVWKNNWIGNLPLPPKNVVIKINSEPKQTASSWSYEAEIVGFINNNDEIFNNVIGKLNLYLSQNSNLHLHTGNQIIIPYEKITPIRDPGNPFEFSFKQYYARKNIHYQSFLEQEDIIKIDTNTSISFAQTIHHNSNQVLSNYISDTITQSLTAAILLNERAQLDASTWTQFSQTGLVHVIAISGMHINVLVAIILGLMSFIYKYEYQWIKYLIAVPIVWFYLAITNYPPSAIRATIMFTIFALSKIVYRDANKYNILILAAVIMLLYNPNWMYDVGAQLSFLAVLSIYIFYEPIQHLIKSNNKALQLIWNSVALSLSVQILVFPIVIFYFHNFPVWFIIANLFAGIYSIILMLGGILVLVFDSVGLSILSSWTADIMVWSNKIFLSFVNLMNEGTPNIFHQLQLDKLGMFIIILLIISILYGQHFKKFKAYYVQVVLVVVFIINIVSQQLIAQQQQYLMVLNVRKTTHVSIINGKKHLIASSNARPNNFDNQIIQNINNELHINDSEHRMLTSKNLLFDYCGKKVLIYNTATIPIPNCDILIVSGHINLYQLAQQLNEPHRFEKIILDSSCKYFQSIKYQSILEEKGYNVHNVMAQGAYVLAKK